MTELPGGGQSGLYEKKILEVQPHFRGGQEGQAQYEMLNFKLVLLKNIEVQSFFLKGGGVKPEI